MSPILMILVLALQEGTEERSLPPTQENGPPTVGLKAGMIGAWTAFDGNALLGSGLFAELDVHFTPTWFAFAQVRTLKYGDDPLLTLGLFLPLSLFGLWPHLDDEMRTVDFMAGAGVNFDLAEWARAEMRVGLGFEHYSGHREATLGFLGIPLAQSSGDVSGNGFLGSFQVSLAFRLTSWLDLESGGVLEFARRRGYDGEGETDFQAGLTLGVALKF